MGYIEFRVYLSLKIQLNYKFWFQRRNQLGMEFMVGPPEQAIKVYTTTFVFLTVEGLETGYK